MSLKNISLAVKKLSKPDRAQALQRFFKTGAGQYAEGDIFVGLTNPEARQIAKNNKDLPFDELQNLIQSKIHEQRFIALVILTTKFKKQQEKCYKFYLNNLNYVNNWDLVDASSYKIVGDYLFTRREEIVILEELAKTNNLWKKRVAMISTLAFIKKGQNTPTYDIAKILLEDKHDLIHKAVGWMLRECGKNNQKQLQDFLKNHYDRIPRTCLRYAIEKFPEPKRKAYLKKQF